MWKRNDGRFDRSEQDVLDQRVDYPRSGSDVGNIVRRAGALALQRLEPGSRDADHGVAVGQLNAAGRLAPERLGFSDLAGAVMHGTVLPLPTDSGKFHP